MNKQIKTVIFSETYKKQRESINTIEVEKLEQAIEVHGYRGPSKKKHNGIVPIRPDDKHLWKSLSKFKENESIEIDNLIENGNKHIADIKVVAHVTNGDRIIGCIYENNKDELSLHILGFSNYNKQLF